MDTPTTAAAFVPAKPTLSELRAAADRCTACELHVNATRTVFGRGPARARVMLVGEQPGDREDLAGRPFVGPAGVLLRRALDVAGIDPRDAYLTNVVKHFRWEQRGKRRIHRKPSMRHVAACRPWLETELALVRPDVLVCLGATAAQAVIGRAFKVTERRGELIQVEGTDALVTATVHPSSILRERGEAARHAANEAFVRDLARAAAVLR